MNAEWDDDWSEASIAAVGVDERGGEFWVVWRGVDHRGPFDEQEHADTTAAKLRSHLEWKRGACVAGQTREYLDGGPEGQDTPEICDMAQDALYFLSARLRSLVEHEPCELTPDQETELDHELLMVVARWMDRNSIRERMEADTHAKAQAAAEAQAQVEADAAVEEAEAEAEEAEDADQEDA